MGLFDGLFGSYSKRELAKIEPIKNKVLALDEEYQAMSEETLKGQTDWQTVKLLTTFSPKLLLR